MVFLCWVVCVCLSVSAWPGCLSLPLDAGHGPQLLRALDHAVAHRTAAAAHPHLPDDALLPLPRLPQDPHSSGLSGGDIRELLRELSSSADSSAAASGSLMEALQQQQQGMYGPQDATVVDLSGASVGDYVLEARPHLLELLDDLVTQQRLTQEGVSVSAARSLPLRHSKTDGSTHTSLESRPSTGEPPPKKSNWEISTPTPVPVNVDNLTFKILKDRETTRKTYQIQRKELDNTKNHHIYSKLLNNAQVSSTYISKYSGNRQQLLQSMSLSSPNDVDNLVTFTLGNGVIPEIAKLAGGVQEIISSPTEEIMSENVSRVKRTSTSLSIDYSLKILRDTLLQELVRKRQQRALLRKLKENEQLILNRG